LHRGLEDDAWLGAYLPDVYLYPYEYIPPGYYV
jgi:hypothetical protein